jgi:Tfp pilus assembly protein PilE
MSNHQKQSGFTAVELLITLFVAAAFLIAGYQLFNVVIRDGGQARAESTAGNVAYDYLRRYAPIATSPCNPTTALSNSPLTIDGLSNATITITISCPTGYSAVGVSRVEATIRYNTPQQTLKYSTYTNGASTVPLDITDSLVGWWKLNGNANDSAGTGNGTVVGASLTMGQNGISNTAYNFNGTSNEISIPDSAALSPTSVITLTAWAKTDTVPSGVLAAVVSKDVSTGIGNPPYDLEFSPGGPLLFRVVNPSNLAGNLTCAGVTAAINTWYFLAGTYDGSTVRMYVNGTACSNTTSLTGGIADTTGLLRIGQQKNGNNRWFDGDIDDVRVYNRVLTPTEIQTVYNGGAK